MKVRSAHRPEVVEVSSTCTQLRRRLRGSLKKDQREFSRQQRKVSERNEFAGHGRKMISRSPVTPEYESKHTTT